jgi:hypothetical protein
VNRDELVRTVFATLVADPWLAKPGWQHLVLVTVHDTGTCDLMGFCYTHEGRTIPVSPRDFGVFDVLGELRAAMAVQDGGEPWVAALFRLEHDTGRVTADFEYERRERWLVTPANVRDRAREFAPPGWAASPGR